MKKVEAKSISSKKQSKQANPAQTGINSTDPLERDEAIYVIKRAHAIAILLSGNKHDVAGPAADAIVQDLSSALAVLEAEEAQS